MVDWTELPKELSFADGTVTAVILGIMQDGGLPHAGCRCERCVTAFNEPEKIEYAACLGWLIPGLRQAQPPKQQPFTYLTPRPTSNTSSICCQRHWVSILND